ncbi:hypothetical protein FQN49_005786, partial [Arthroderma sp. PD_2]
MNSEIDEIVEEKGLKTSLDKDAMVKIVSWDDQWVTYDDEQTLAMRTAYARKRCLGGVMVWAISHDTSKGDYSRALGKSANRAFGSRKTVEGEDGSPIITIRENVNQCKWTGCGEPCPNGYALVRRTDPGARENEGMYDQTGCAKGIHSWCCPTDRDTPKCGWYDHNNGKCSNDCPSGMTEIGSNSRYCNNEGYQAACCTQDTDSMELYTALEWSKAPECAAGSCPWVNQHKDQILGESSSGSGGAVCDKNYRDGTPRFPVLSGHQQRKLCYGTRD